MEKFTILKRLGQGSFGVVYKVRRKDDNKKYALKRINLKSMCQKQIEDALNEVRLLASLQHNHIIKFLEAFPAGKNKYNMRLYIIMEYARGGDLANEIKKYKINKLTIPEHRIWKYIHQISDALDFLHSNNILHRDIKAANCFLTSEGNIKIGDMNISKIVKNGQFARTCIGTPYYMSPEVWRHKLYNSKCDVWSCGCLFYELAILEPPFKGRTTVELSRKICSGFYRKPHNSNYTLPFWNLIASMLKVRPLLRPSMDIINKIANKYINTHNNISTNILPQAQLLQTIRMMPTVEQLTERMPKAQYEKIKQRKRKLEVVNENNNPSNVNNENRLPSIYNRWRYDKISGYFRQIGHNCK
jgi:NIMA (never in mitosis gene a)-related kinase 1/4/5